MCGIVGLVGLDAPLPELTSFAEAMARRIAHRGPDGGGVAAHPDATLAMRRLAIVDVEHGHQPMASDDGSIVIVYNGETYNAPELRRGLEREGVRFRTRSDTEVVLRLYERNPERVEEELNGMWAFALHDRRRRRVVLSRDRFGIKPLFVADTGSALAFASELRCFDRALPPFEPLFELDPDAAHAMLSWAYVPEDATIYRGVERLPPATRLEVDLRSGKRTRRVYWTLRPDAAAERTRSLEDACALVEEALRRAVREHLESDVPIATFLSGGIDSALVTDIAVSESRAPLRSFSIAFSDKAFDESAFAAATARKIGVTHEIRTLDLDATRRGLADAFLAYDEPFGDSSSLATLFLCKEVARDYKVALGGDGADEVFGGYKKHSVIRLRRPFERMPALRDALGRALARLPMRTDRTRRWTELSRQAQRLARGLTGSDADIYADLTQVVSLAVTAPLVPSSSGASRFLETARVRYEHTPGTALRRTLTSDLRNPLCNDMLVKIDRASMAHHLEVRVPFLDHRLVEIGVGLPGEFTLGRHGKRVLRALHARRFGAALAGRAKQGFRVPVEKWLQGPFDGVCERLFEGSRLERFGLLAPDALSQGRHRAWAKTHPIVLWHALALAAWCEANLGDGPDAVRALMPP